MAGLLDLMKQKWQGLLNTPNAGIDATRGLLMGATTDTLGYIPDAVADAMRPFGYDVPREQVIGGADWWANKLTSPTGSGAETAGRMLGGMLSPGIEDVGRAAGLIARKPSPLLDVTGYHGTAGDFDAFDSAKRGTLTGARSARAATWLTSDGKTARSYAVYAAEDGPVKELLDKAATYERLAQKTGSKAYWDKYDELLRQAEDLDTGPARYARREANAKVLKVDIPDELDLLEIDGKGLTPQELAEGDDIDSWLMQAIKEAKRQGKAGLKISNLDDAVNLNAGPQTHYAVFDPSVLKIIGRE